ncbi:hypothetical protein M2454_001224 [Aequitasia blattaphilus]|uniref:DUF6465 family protein n=1 Tax=Aequitasia blattaphilus TaxID=2949332 RepID=A0ABT1E6M8_9FIRM|nr:DUF6465 family protein [Aequitasia blattaphilus]MCP1101488.1 DUF6465 family protein [Aequitasia blattaphilus]MCR8614128.1 DUF6465 family protein [Aequitasia blattaphilus]
MMVVKSKSTKSAATKETEKTPAKKTVKKTVKKEMKVSTTIEYYGNQLKEKDIIANVKKAWRASGNKVSDIKTMELYVKPEDYSVYYVINGDKTGSISF